jgi:NADPH:quinone reductase-like Zn-dependent oxidoreductase
MVRSIGADHVIDYNKEDYTKGTQRYDLIFDTVGNHPLLDHRHVLTARGILVIVGGSSADPWLGPLARFLEGYVISPFMSQKFLGFLADTNKTEDLNHLRDLMQAGKLTPVIDRQFGLNEVPAAIRYLETGHVRGKLVIDVE